MTINNNRLTKYTKLASYEERIAHYEETLLAYENHIKEAQGLQGSGVKQLKQLTDKTSNNSEKDLFAIANAIEKGIQIENQVRKLKEEILMRKPTK